MKHVPSNVTAHHLIPFFYTKERRRVIREVVKLLKPMKFDAIAFRGLSGALLAPTVALRLNKSLIAVRKQISEHSSFIVEGDKAALRYVIVDDLIATGSTAKTIMRKVKRFQPAAKCIGVVQAYHFTEQGKNRHITADYCHIFETSIVEDWEASDEQ